MSSKSLRLFACAVLALGLGAFGTVARGVNYSVPFDPIGAGILDLDIGVPCLSPSGSTHPCLIDFLSLDFTDSHGNTWGLDGPYTESDPVQINGSGDFVAFAATISSHLSLLSDTDGCAGGDESLMFDLPSDSTDGRNLVAFTCGGVTDTGTYTVVPAPEPATLALLGLGLAGLAASRRRKLN